jgi:hypothetical protein
VVGVWYAHIFMDVGAGCSRETRRKLRASSFVALGPGFLPDKRRKAE